MGRRRKPQVPVRKSAVTEEIPLLPEPGPSVQSSSHTLQWTKDSSGEEELEEDLHWLNIIVNPNKRNKGTVLLITDALLLILHYIQVFAVLQSLAIRWPWPDQWLRWSSFFFFANVDIWEFLKLYENGVFKYVQDYFVPSADMVVDYMHLEAAWGVLLFILLIIYLACYLAFTRRKSPLMLVRMATLKRILIVFGQVLGIPIGVFLFRLFHCTEAEVVDVKNELYCFRDTHWAYLAPAIVVLFLIFIAFPAWLIVRTKEEMLNMSPRRHEAYLQLKEMEYIHGLDVVWIVGNFHIFASFKKPAAHFRACHHLMLGILLVIYAAFFQQPFIQAVILNCILFVMFVVFIALRPFRVAAYNYMLIINYLCLTANCLMGCFKTSYNFDEAQSPFLLPDYQFICLCIINGFWAICVVLFLMYITARMSCCRHKGGSLWPYTKFERLSPETRKYVKSVIIGRLLVEKTLSVHPMFAPVHEVARYIHIINAYCREAEQLGDPLQHTLWDVLDELVEVHTNIAPKSLFAESTKTSIRTTAAEFLTLMPTFVRRLAQREYDFILINPKKRRILLKLYCLSLFLKLRKDRRDHQDLSAPAVQKLWHKQSDEESDPGYYEDMYPPKEPIIAHRTYNYDADTLIQLEDDLDEDDNDDAVIEETEAWLRRQGVSSRSPADPLDEWMDKIGVPTERPDTAISDIVLPSDFTIPGLTYIDGSLMIPDGESVGRSRSASAASFRPSSATLQAGLSPRPGGSSRPSSAASMLSVPPQANQAFGSRPSSATSPRGSGMLRSGSVTPLQLQEVEDSLPGAVLDPDTKSVQSSVSVGSRSGSLAQGMGSSGAN